MRTTDNDQATDQTTDGKPSAKTRAQNEKMFAAANRLLLVSYVAACSAWKWLVPHTGQQSYDLDGVTVWFGGFMHAIYIPVTILVRFLHGDSDVELYLPGNGRWYMLGFFVGMVALFWVLTALGKTLVHFYHWLAKPSA